MSSILLYLSWVCIVILVSYLVLLLFANYGWYCKPVFRLTDKQRLTYRFSVLIPVRNEAGNIQNLLLDLERQDFPHRQFEVIVLNDNSTDGTKRIVERLVSVVSYSLRLIDVPVFESANKKRALAIGVEQSRFDYILTTDGDCRLPPTWISCYAHFFKEKKAVFVAGAVKLNEKRDFFAALQASEFAALIGSGAASLHLGYAFTCNGANLGYKKQVYQQLGGYNPASLALSSGDDEFLLHQFHAHYPQQTLFLKAKEVIVCTEAMRTWKDFYHQRKRWASKWNQHKKRTHALLGVLVFGVQLLQLMGIANYLLEFLPYSRVIIGLILIKFILEGVFVCGLLFFLGQVKISYTIFIWWVLYSFYALFFGLAVQKKGYIWKERKTK